MKTEEPETPDLALSCDLQEEFFHFLRSSMDTWSPRRSAEVNRHLEYLASKAGTTVSVILQGTVPSVDPQIVSDAIRNIRHVLEMDERRLPDPTREYRAGAERMPPPVVIKVIERAEADLQGWCTRAKSILLAQLIIRERPRICVEIGVFGGRSIVPIAAALRHVGQGWVYGVETWTAATATEFVTNDANDEWWKSVDYSKLKKAFLGFLIEHDLTEQVRMIEAPSHLAAGTLPEIDFVHIDGAHSVFNAAEDVVLFLRRVRTGGIVVMDDVDWPTTAPAYQIAKQLCETITVLRDEETGRESCAVMRTRHKGRYLDHAERVPQGPNS